jgi:hypothetical protein
MDKSLHDIPAFGKTLASVKSSSIASLTAFL